MNAEIKVEGTQAYLKVEGGDLIILPLQDYPKAVIDAFNKAAAREAQIANVCMDCG